MAKGDKKVKPSPKIVEIRTEPNANISAIAAGETFEVVADNNGHAVLNVKSGAFNLYLVVNKEGYAPFRDWYNIAGAQHVFIPVITLTKLVVVPTYKLRNGIVKLNRAVAYDDNGNRLFLSCTLFPARWMYENERERFAQNLKFLADNRVDAIRYFEEVGGVNNPADSWYDRSVSPSTPNRKEFIDFVLSYGIRLQPVIFGGINYSDTPEKRLQLVRNVVETYKDIPGAITYYQVANESFKNFPMLSEVNSLADYIKQNTPNLVTPSSPLEWTEIPFMYKGDLIALHHERQYGEDGWRYVRQPYSAREISGYDASSNEEGLGPKSSGEQDANSLRLAMYAATGWITRSPFYCYHPGAGVYLGGQGGRSHNRESNLWEVENVQETLDAINYVRDTIPHNVPNWNEYNGNKTEHLLPAEHVWVDGYEDGVTRTYMAINGNNFVMLPYGIKKFSKHVAKALMTITVRDVVERRIVDDKTLAPGDIYTFQGTPAGYLVTGELL